MVRVEWLSWNGLKFAWHQDHIKHTADQKSFIDNPPRRLFLLNFFYETTCPKNWLIMTTTTKVKGYARSKLLFHKIESESIEASQYLNISAPIEALNTWENINCQTIRRWKWVMGGMFIESMKCSRPTDLPFQTSESPGLEVSSDLHICEKALHQSPGVDDVYQ